MSWLGGSAVGADSKREKYPGFKRKRGHDMKALSQLFTAYNNIHFIRVFQAMSNRALQII